MSKPYLSRYNLILKKIKANPYCTIKEIAGYIEYQQSFQKISDDGLNAGVSERTIERDMADMRKLGYAIEYDRKQKGYFISESLHDNTSTQRMLETFELSNLLHLSDDLKAFVHFEKRAPLGLENLHGFLHAIKNKLQIKFEHYKFWEEGISQRIADPYMLKEFDNRWYLVAKDQKDGHIKTFALDRISNLDITNKKFAVPKDFDAGKKYAYYFGIISPEEGQEPENIILSFTQLQGRYVKSLPLHHTQQVLVDNETELQVSLRLYITHDFIMQLLSYGADMKVLHPLSLAESIRSEHVNASSQYEYERHRIMNDIDW